MSVKTKINNSKNDERCHEGGTVFLVGFISACLQVSDGSRYDGRVDGWCVGSMSKNRSMSNKRGSNNRAAEGLNSGRTAGSPWGVDLVNSFS